MMNRYKCKCCLAVAEIFSLTSSFKESIREKEILRIKSSPEMIDAHRFIVKQVSNNLQNIKKFCGIDISKEDECVKYIIENISEINISKKRDEILKNANYITYGIKKKIEERIFKQQKI